MSNEELQHEGPRRLVGAHSIPAKHLYAVSRVSGVVMSLIATAMGLFVLRNSTLLFDTGPWVHFVEFIKGNKLIPGWILLAGGLLGVIGLVARRRAISIASCVVCLGWCGWISSFLWYANATGEPNLGSFFSIIAAVVFILRFWLLVVVPEPGEEIGRGW